MHMGQQMHLQHDDRQDQGTSLKLDLLFSSTNPDQSLSKYCWGNSLNGSLALLSVKTTTQKCWRQNCNKDWKMASSSMCVQQCHFTSNRSDGSIAAKSFCLLLTRAHWVLLTALRMCLPHNYTTWLRSRFCGIMFKSHLCLGTFYRTIPQTAAARGGPEGINPKLPLSTPWYHSAMAPGQNTVTKHLCPTCCPKSSHWQCFRPAPVNIKAKLPTSTSSSHTRSIHSFYKHTWAHFNEIKRKPGQHIPLWTVFTSDTKQH